MLNKLMGAVLSGTLLIATAVHAQAPARVFFVEPKDGATVTSPVHVKFGVEGMKVAPAGTMTENTGHHHLLIDGGRCRRARSSRPTTNRCTSARARPKPT